MLRGVVFLGFALAVLVWPAGLRGQSALDPDVAKGMRQVDDGDYDAAIVSLDAAARRLSADPARAKDLSQAYLYLGIAYVGKGHEAAAKAKFREALAGIKDLTLSPDQFPPKVINLFEAAKEEASRSAVVSKPALEKKKGGSKGLVIGGVVAAGAAGAVLAASGGKSSGPAAAPVPAPTPPPPPVTDTFEGLLSHNQPSATIPLPVAASAGPWKAELEWSGGEQRTEVRMFVVDAATKEGVAETRLTAPTASVAEWAGAPGKGYEIALFLQEGGARSSNYILHVTHPR